MTKNEFWKNKNVFVTGATGFLGSWLVKELLFLGAKVVVLVRDEEPEANFYRLGLGDKTTIVKGDLADFFILERILNEYEIDTCFHLAAQPIVTVANRSPLSTFESNIKGSWNLFEAARVSRLLKRLVIASSDKAYGESERLPYSEDMPLCGDHPYDVSKSCVDLLAQTYAKTYKMPLAISRCGNFYGGGDLHWNRIVPGTFKSIVRGERPIIRTDGTLIRDYFYIQDVVNAYLVLGENLERPEIQGQAFNFGTETPLSVSDLVQKMLKISGRVDLLPLVLNQWSNEIPIQYLSCEKARRLLDWKPEYSLESGLSETWRWYKDFFNVSEANSLGADAENIIGITPKLPGYDREFLKNISI